MNNSLNYYTFRSLPLEIKKKIIINSDVKELAALYFRWEFWARDKQILPDEIINKNSNKYIWLIMAGRGFGKTRAGAEAIRMAVEKYGYKRISLVGADAGEVRDIMVEGDSGILNISPPWNKPVYEPSKRRITWRNGAVATIFYGSEPDKSRGAQSDFIWCDELIKWKYPKETMDNLLFGLRLGEKPVCVITTTPRPISVLKELINDDDVVVTKGTSYENIQNLSPSFINTIIKKYEGTRIGRQELYAELLTDNPNALWKRDLLDELRVAEIYIDKLQRIVVGVDPMASSENEKAMTGIVVVGEIKDKFYVLGDYSISGHPNVWAQQIISVYYKFRANVVVVEKNNGGDMCESVIRNIDKNANVKMVWASRGKYVRAEPIAALYEQKRVFHCGFFKDLEDEMCEWDGSKDDTSPNRMDALVWAITYLTESVVPPDAPSPTKLSKTKRSEVKGLPSL